MTVDAFAELQNRLAAALAANRPGSGIEHTLIVLPSYSVGESLLSHYGDRVAVLEHRYLNALLIADRIQTCQVLFISTRRPDPAVIEYYLSLVPPYRRSAMRSRLRLYAVDDGTQRSVAAKVLVNDELLRTIRASLGHMPALIEPWNVTDAEVALALALGVPINGTRPELRPLGFKSAGRKLFRRLGIPLPDGSEDVRSVADVVAAIEALWAADPRLRGVVVKHDDSGAGDGNVVIDLQPVGGHAGDEARSWLRQRVTGLPEWYLADLAKGGVVETLIAGDGLTSPSAQVDIRPGGEVVVLATHEQVLGGDTGQVYLGCRFPANPMYAPELARHAGRIGEALASEGVVGRFSVDFIAVAREAGTWQVYALEVNLRKGGTTHPYAALRNLVPGRYDAEQGCWIATADGSARSYSATDNLFDPAWRGRSPAAVIEAVRSAGLQFDPETGTGTILHMLAGLAVDGRIGLTAIATSPDQAETLLASAREAISSARPA